MKKMLMLASVASMIDQFNMPNIKLLLDMGYQVEVACNFKEGNNCSNEKIAKLMEELNKLGVNYYQIDFSRNIFNIKGNLKAYKQVNELMTNNQYSFVHCHSPIGGVIARLVGIKTKVSIIYTAHGFHFYKGAPLKNWILYYPIEWILAHWTNILITINQEDYALAQKHMHAKKVEYVPGIGIDVNKFSNIHVSRNEKRKELGIPQDAVLLISVGELNENKNHETVIKAINGMNVYYIIAGIGDKKEQLQRLINEQKMQDKVKLLGFRTDINELYAMADVFVFPSFREGLSVALMEAMASGLPCVVSKIRGNMDLIDENGGELFNPHDIQECKNMVERILALDIKKIGAYNSNKIKKFSNKIVLDKMKKIYEYDM